MLGVELRGKTTNIAREIEGPGATRNSGKAHEHFGLLTDFSKNIGGGVVCERIGQLEHTMCTVAPRMYDTLRNTLMIEMEYLFAQYKVFEQRRATPSGTQTVLTVCNRMSLLRGQRSCGIRCFLMGFPAIALRFCIAGG